MLKNSTTVIPYEDIDYELRKLIRLINEVDGIETTSCCCGHGKMPCLIDFKADSIECVTKFMHRYLYRNHLWRVVFNMTDTEIDNGEWDNPTFLLETTFPDYFYVGLAIDCLTNDMIIKQTEEHKCNTCKKVRTDECDVKHCYPNYKDYEIREEML